MSFLDSVGAERGANYNHRFPVTVEKQGQHKCEFLFRRTLLFQVQTKALTAEDLTQANIQQFDFRSNLKKSKTNENLAELKFDSDSADERPMELDSELDAKLKRMRATIEEPFPGTHESDDTCDLTSVSDLPADHDLQSTQINSTLDHVSSLDGIVNDMR